MFGRKSQRIAELERQNAEMRQALLWYATEENWRRKGIHPKGARKKWRKSPAAFDRGAVANQALDAVDPFRPQPVARVARREIDVTHIDSTRTPETITAGDE